MSSARPRHPLRRCRHVHPVEPATNKYPSAKDSAGASVVRRPKDATEIALTVSISSVGK